VLDDQVAHRERAIHALRQLRLPYFELEVDQPTRVRDHRVVVAPTESEDAHLDVGGELGAETSELELVRKGCPDVDVGVGCDRFRQRDP
jgi:hypothetical protein